MRTVLFFTLVSVGAAEVSGQQSARLTVGVTVVRPCTTDAAALEDRGIPALSCASDPHSGIRLRPGAVFSEALTPNGFTVITVNF